MPVYTSVICKGMKPEEFNHTIVPMRAGLKEQARRMTGDDALAEDLVQEVMLRMWSMRQSLERYSDKRALAVTILRNMVCDRWRHSRLEQGKPSDGGEPVAEDLTAERHDEAELVRLIVEHLPPLQARIFRMKEIEGYDSKEIMQITGCSAESLRQNLSRARRKILSDFTKLTRMIVKNNVDDTTGRTLS